MDEWTEDQMKKMRVGRTNYLWEDSAANSRYKISGNLPFMTFMKDYGEQGGYKEGMTVVEKYNCWAAAQYKEKVCSHHLWDNATLIVACRSRQRFRAKNGPNLHPRQALINPRPDLLPLKGCESRAPQVGTVPCRHFGRILRPPPPTDQERNLLPH